MVFHVGNMGVLMYSAGCGYINIPACYGYLVQTYQGALMGEQSHLLSSCSLQLSSDYELASFHIFFQNGLGLIDHQLTLGVLKAGGLIAGKWFGLGCTFNVWWDVCDMRSSTHLHALVHFVQAVVRW